MKWCGMCKNAIKNVMIMQLRISSLNSILYAQSAAILLYYGLKRGDCQSENNHRDLRIVKNSRR